mgnify:CR=1 FL=1
MGSVLNIIRPAWRVVSVYDLPHQTFNIGLTGGIGSGKSTVAGILRTYGIPVVDLDQISRDLTAENGLAVLEIAAHFGSQAMLPSGALNRTFMRELVFNEPEKKSVLEQILHPMILRSAREQAHELAKHASCIVYDIPLLTESESWQQRLDWIAVVTCDVPTQIQRVQGRNPEMSVETIRAIILSQAMPEQREAIANVLIDNKKQVQGLNLKHQVAILAQYIKIRQCFHTKGRHALT